MKPFVDFAIGVAISAAVLYGFWHWFGSFGLVYAMPVLAILARSLVEIMAWFPRFAAHLALRPVAGRYYEFRGRAMDIHIDQDACCWVSTADARKVVALPADAVLSRVVPLHCLQLGDPPQWRITTQGLAQFLARSTDADVGKFCHWLEVQVARPARNRLERGMTVRY